MMKSEAKKSTGAGQLIWNGLSVILGLVALLFPVFIVLHLGRGIDLSDTGFYYLSLHHWDEIPAYFTTTYLLWEWLPIPRSIYADRLALFAGLMASASFLAIESLRFCSPPRALSRYVLFLAVCMAMGTVSLIYSLWLPDPSYNSIPIVLTMVLIGLTLMAIRKHQDRHILSWPLFMLIGAMGVLLLSIRPPAATLLAFSLFLLLLYGGLRRFSDLLKVCGFAMLGGFTFLHLIHVFVQPIPDLWVNAGTSLRYLEILSGNRPRKSILEFGGQTIGYSLTHPVWMTVVISSGVSLIILRSFPPKRLRGNPPLSKGLHWGLTAVLVGAVLALPLMAVGPEPTWTGKPVHAIGWSGSALLIVLFGLAVFRAVASRKPLSQHRSLFLALILIMGGAAQMWLTSQSMVNAVSTLGMIALFALPGLLAVVLGRTRLALIAFLPVLFIYQQTAFTRLTEEPYRLAAPLDQQTEIVALRRGEETLRVDADKKVFLDAMSEAGRCMPMGEDRPILIDGSGRVPFIVYHLKARSAPVGWSLSAYKTSQNMFDTMIREMPDQDIQGAWILVAPNYARGHDLNVLSVAGREFPEDYRFMGEGFEPHLGQRLALYAPRSIESDPQIMNCLE